MLQPLAVGHAVEIEDADLAILQCLLTVHPDNLKVDELRFHAVSANPNTIIGNLRNFFPNFNLFILSVIKEISGSGRYACRIQVKRAPAGNIRDDLALFHVAGTKVQQLNVVEHLFFAAVV